MRKLAGTTWGADSSILTKVYRATVWPTIEYASTTWGTAAKTNKSRLYKIQNMALRVILGALKTTPVHDMEKTANVELLERRRSLKILIQGEKLRRLPSHPLHTNLAQPTKNHPERQSLNHQYKELSRTHQDIVDESTELLTDPAWKPDRVADIQMFLSVRGFTSKEQLPGELRNLTLALVADRFPHTAWTHVYTDGSAEEGMKNGGSGVYIWYSDGDTTSLPVPGGLQCSNYRAEILAICTATEHLLESRKKWEISPSSLTLYQPLKPSAQLIQSRWSKACTPPLTRQRGQDTSPLSVQWRLEERQRWISGTPWPNLETGMGPADHYLPPEDRALWSECPSEEDCHFRHFPLWVQTSWPNPRTRPSVLPKICRETSANMAATCWSGDQAVGLGRTAGFVASTGLKIWPARLPITEEEEGVMIDITNLCSLIPVWMT